MKNTRVTGKQNLDERRGLKQHNKLYVASKGNADQAPKLDPELDINFPARYTFPSL
jgi:hypothetical protein